MAVSSAQLLALAATPILIVPAPGAGKMILPIMTSYEFIFGTTPYTNSGGTVRYFGVRLRSLAACNFGDAEVFEPITIQLDRHGVGTRKALCLPMCPERVLRISQSCSAWTM